MFFCQSDPPISESSWQKNRMATHIYFLIYAYLNILAQSQILVISLQLGFCTFFIMPNTSIFEFIAIILMQVLIVCLDFHFWCSNCHHQELVIL